MKAEMSSRERVLACFRLEEPDRVPIDYSANPGIDARLKSSSGLAADDHEGLRRALGVDFRSVGAPYRGPKRHPDLPGVQVDLWGIHRKWIEHPTGGYWDYCDFPLRDAGIEEIEAWPMPDPDDFDYGAVKSQCSEHTGYAISAGGAGTGDIINSTGMIRTMERTLMDLATDDPACLRYVDRRLGVLYEVMRRTLEAAGGAIDFLRMGEDLGTQLGPMVSAELYRRHIRPRHQRFVDLAKRHGIPVMIHCCGSSSWAFPDFVEMGIRVVDTLQPEAAHMAPAELKARFGRSLAFHGCISTAGAMATGTAQEAAEEVRSTLEVMMPGGGYAMAPTHQIQDNSPTENVLAVYRAAREMGRY
jgi:uroporphyrinogen decarboxylase